MKFNWEKMLDQTKRLRLFVITVIVITEFDCISVKGYVSKKKVGNRWCKLFCDRSILYLKNEGICLFVCFHLKSQKFDIPAKILNPSLGLDTSSDGKWQRRHGLQPTWQRQKPAVWARLWPLTLIIAWQTSWQFQSPAFREIHDLKFKIKIR